MIYHELIVVGGGLSGLRAAIEAQRDGVDVAVVSQVWPGRSHSGAAQGGINAALANHPDSADDTWERHAFDTVKGSDYLADQDAVAQMTQDAIPTIYEMERMGCPFSRLDNGRIAQRPFGGAGYPRTCYGADKTGHYLLHTVVEEALRQGVTFYTEWFVSKLVVEDGVCRGVVAYDMTRGGFQGFHAEAVVMATGGAGRTYSNSTNAITSPGGVMALAYHAGAARGHNHGFSVESLESSAGHVIRYDPTAYTVFYHQLADKPFRVEGDSLSQGLLHHGVQKVVARLIRTVAGARISATPKGPLGNAPVVQATKRTPHSFHLVDCGDGILGHLGHSILIRQVV